MSHTMTRLLARFRLRRVAAHPDVTVVTTEQELRQALREATVFCGGVEMTCWFDFEDGHTCMLPDGHDGPHEPTPDDEIIISLGGT